MIRFNFRNLSLSAIIIYVIESVICGCLWSYSLNYWLPHFDIVSHVDMIKCLVLGLIPGIGELAVITALITWIIAP